MTEQAGREKIAGGRNRNRLLISLPHLIRMSSGFLFSAIILLFAERITMLDVAIIMSVGIVLSYFLIRGDAVIIDQLVSYFRQKELSEEPAASVPTMHLNEKYLTNATDGLTELRWLVSSAEQKSALAHKNLISDNIYRTEIMRHLPFPLMLVDGRGYVEEYNEQADLLFGPITIAKPVDFAIRSNDVLQKIQQVSDGTIPAGETQMTLRGTFVQHFTVLISQFITDDVPRIAVIFIDRSAAIEAEKMRADFVANVSHELRTPLTSILGFVETLQGVAGQDEAIRAKFLAILQQQSERMVRLVADQLSLSRIEQTENVQPEAIINLTEMAERVLTSLEKQAGAANITLSITAPPLPVLVRGEADELIQMIQNLTENAIRYGHQGGFVKVIIDNRTSHPSITHKDGCFSVAVSDDGDGIAEEHLPRLTERFYRVDAGRSREIGGTGLGLAIVKHIVNRHRGVMDITSHIGTGTTFTIYLPMIKQADTSQ